MAIHHEAPPDARPRLSTAGTVARLTLIGIALAGVAGTFAYLGGWLTPNALTPARFTDAFEEVNGVHPGFRRNHAKGVGVSGFFESNGNLIDGVLRFFQLGDSIDKCTAAKFVTGERALEPVEVPENLLGGREAR